MTAAAVRLQALLPLLPLLFAASLPAQQLPADWAQRDLEGKWVCYRADCERSAKDPNRRQSWATLLATAGEFELLELIALHEGWRFAGKALAGTAAPQVFRVAHWNLGAFDSHNRDRAESALLARPAEALRWFADYPAARRGKGAAIAGQLQGEPAAVPSTQLPPHDPMQVLVPFLDVAGELVDFGQRRRADPGVVYRHQVLRALDGVLVYGEVEAPLIPKVMALCTHGDEQVRTAAFLTLTKVPGDLVPWPGLLRLCDADGPREVRCLAATALSYSSHPRAWWELLRIAVDAAHPAAIVASQRVAELADASTAAECRRVAALGAGDADRLQHLAADAEAKAAGVAVDGQLARSWLWRAAWLRQAGDARTEAVAPAIVDGIRARLPAEQQAAVREFAAAEPEPGPFRGDEWVRVRDALRALWPH